jgi:predicted Zn finger-like uncharacterized protein
MIIPCENCNVRFNLDENLIKESGSKVRCSKCQHIFVAYKPASAEEDRPVPDVAEESAEQPDVWAEQPPSSGETDDSEEQGPEVPEALSDEPLDFDLFESEQDQDEEGFSLEDLGFGDDASPAEKPQATEETAAEEDIVVQEEITAQDLGFEDEQAAEAVAEPTEEAASEEDVEQEAAIPDISLAEEPLPEEAPPSTEQVVGEELEAEEEISLEDLSLEEEPVADEALQTTEETAEEEISLEDLSLEEPSAEEEFPEALATEEEADQEPEEIEMALPEDVPVASLEETEEIEAEEREEEFVPVPPPIAQQEPPSRRRISMPFMVLLVLVLVGGGAYAAYTVLESLDIKIPFLESLKGAATSEGTDPGNMQASLLEGLISGEFVDNKSAGRLFVIKGKLRNDYRQARNFIRVKGILYLKDGKVAQDRIVYCGNVLSDTDLQVLDKETINQKLGNRFGADKSNFRVPSGKVVPFMVVFSDIPQQVGEFSVEVVDSVAG